MTKKKETKETKEVKEPKKVTEVKLYKDDGMKVLDPQSTLIERLKQDGWKEK